MDGLSSSIDVLVQVHQHLAIILCMCRGGKAGERVKVISGSLQVQLGPAFR
jgi:hypothetical protein